MDMSQVENDATSEEKRKEACDQQQKCSVRDGCGDSASSCRTLETTESATGSGGGGGGDGDSGTGGIHIQLTGQTQPSTHATPIPTPIAQQPHHPSSVVTCFSSFCAKSAKKIYFGICVTLCVTASWVGATHCIKYLYFHKSDEILQTIASANSSSNGLHHQHIIPPYNAPFFTTWFCTNWEVLYFPVYFICRAVRTKCVTPSEIIAESFRGFRDKGFTGGRFLIRCSLFCALWVITNYLYILSLRILLSTDVMALYATNVSCVYLLSWVILHEQFVGVRIVAVILCNTGIALLAYMDGITGSPTLGGVVLATAAAAGSAVYKVLFKKVIGETTFGQMSLFFSLIGLCNATLLWPVCLTLYFSGVETMYWARFPWAALLSASILHLVANMIGNFSIAFTYDLFITLGLITAVPVSAALDIIFYGACFMGMKLAGLIFIAVGFFLVMFPDNWPDYITKILRNVVLMSHSTSTTGGDQQRGSKTIVRSRAASIQQRQQRLRSYGVSTAHGDGQTLLPISSNSSSNSQPATHRHVNNSQQYSSTSEIQSRRVLPSISTSITSTSTSTAVNVVNNSYSHDSHIHQQGGAGDTGMVRQMDRRVM